MPYAPRTPCTYCGQPAVKRGRCNRHARDTTAGRGYGANHKRLRRDWQPLINAGRVRCARCNEPIAPNEPWDLGHDDRDRSRYNGPEHANHCNRASAAKRLMSQ